MQNIQSFPISHTSTSIGIEDEDLALDNSIEIVKPTVSNLQALLPASSPTAPAH